MAKISPPMKEKKVPGNHMSDKSKSKSKFEKEEFAGDRKMKPKETLRKDYKKDEKNLKPKHKGKKQP